MKERKRIPGHPGGILKRQYMEPLNLTVSGLAREMGVSRKTISKITNEHAAISAEMALRLSQAFNTSPELWLNLQRNHDLFLARSTTGWQTVRRLAV